jgi:hypothetical protein
MRFELSFQKLVKKLGRSAATTYWWLRVNGQPASFALSVAKSQVCALGETYAGGFDCVPFRKMREESRE